MGDNVDTPETSVTSAAGGGRGGGDGCDVGKHSSMVGKVGGSGGAEDACDGGTRSGGDDVGPLGSGSLDGAASEHSPLPSPKSPFIVVESSASPSTSAPSSSNRVPESTAATSSRSSYSFSSGLPSSSSSFGFFSTSSPFGTPTPSKSPGSSPFGTPTPSKSPGTSPFDPSASPGSSPFGTPTPSKSPGTSPFGSPSPSAAPFSPSLSSPFSSKLQFDASSPPPVADVPLFTFTSPPPPFGGAGAALPSHTPVSPTHTPVSPTHTPVSSSHRRSTRRASHRSRASIPSNSGVPEPSEPAHEPFESISTEYVRHLISSKEPKDAVNRRISGTTPLIYAIRTYVKPESACFVPTLLELGDVNKLIEIDADVDGADQHGNTPLEVAASLGREGAIAALLARGANPNAPPYFTDVDGQNWHAHATALAHAVWGNHMSIVLELLNAGADVNARFADDQMVNCFDALTTAAYKGELEVLQVLLNAGASFVPPKRVLVHPRDQEKLYHERWDGYDAGTLQSALMFASMQLHHQCAMCLVVAGAQLLPDEIPRHMYRLSFLTTAAWLGLTEDVRRLLEGNGPEKFTDHGSGTMNRPCAAAASRGHVDILSMLIDHGFDFTTRVENIRWGLGRVCGYVDIDETLSKRGPGAPQCLLRELNDALARAKSMSPLHMAIACAQEDAIVLLLDRGAEIDLKALTLCALGRFSTLEIVLDRYLGSGKHVRPLSKLSASAPTSPVSCALRANLNRNAAFLVVRLRLSPSTPRRTSEEFSGFYLMHHWADFGFRYRLLWPCTRLLFIGHSPSNPDCAHTLQRLPIELVRMIVEHAINDRSEEFMGWALQGVFGDAEGGEAVLKEALDGAIASNKRKMSPDPQMSSSTEESGKRKFRGKARHQLGGEEEDDDDEVLDAVTIRTLHKKLLSRHHHDFVYRTAAVYTGAVLKSLLVRLLGMAGNISKEPHVEEGMHVISGTRIEADDGVFEGELDDEEDVEGDDLHRAPSWSLKPIILPQHIREAVDGDVGGFALLKSSDD